MRELGPETGKEIFPPPASPRSRAEVAPKIKPFRRARRKQPVPRAGMSSRAAPVRPRTRPGRRAQGDELVLPVPPVVEDPPRPGTACRCRASRPFLVLGHGGWVPCATRASNRATVAREDLGPRGERAIGLSAAFFRGYRQQRDAAVTCERALEDRRAPLRRSKWGARPETGALESVHNFDLNPRAALPTVGHESRLRSRGRPPARAGHDQSTHIASRYAKPATKKRACSYSPRLLEQFPGEAAKTIAAHDPPSPDPTTERRRCAETVRDHVKSLGTRPCAAARADQRDRLPIV